MLKKQMSYVSVVFLSFWLLATVPAQAQGTWSLVYHEDQHPTKNIGLDAVAYGNGLFVAVGDANGKGNTGNRQATIMVSSDGSSWSDVSPNLNVNGSYLWDVIYVNGQFVAVGNDNTQATGYNEETLIVTSSDGLNWQQVSHSGLPLYNFWAYIAYGSNHYVLVAGTSLYYSSDLVNWSEASKPNSISGIYWNDVVYGNGLFVTIGRSGGSYGTYRLVSSDGVSWSIQADSQVGHNTVEFVNGQFVNVGVLDGAYLSSDTISWEEVTPKLITATTMFSVDYANNTYVFGGGAIGTGNSSGYVWLTADFKNWWKQHLNSEWEGGIKSLAHDTAGFVGISDNDGMIFYSAFSSASNAPQFTSSSTITAAMGEMLEYTVTTSGMPVMDYYYHTYNLDPGSTFYQLPKGLNFSTATGVLSGTPNAEGSTELRFSLKPKNTVGVEGWRAIEAQVSLVIGNAAPTWYNDSDGDGYGNSSVSIDSTSQPSGYVSDNTDCDDTDATVYPGATEIAGDGIDQDCNGSDLSGSTSNGTPGTACSVTQWQVTLGTGQTGQNTDGTYLMGATYRGNHKMNSVETFDLLNKKAYIKWKANSKNVFGSFWVGAAEQSAGFFTTDHSWKNSTVIESEKWYYTSLEFKSDNTYTTSTCTDAYCDNGGTSFYSTSGAMSQNSIASVSNASIYAGFNDVYATDPLITIGEAKSSCTGSGGKPVGNSITIKSDLSFKLPEARYQSLTGDVDLWIDFKFFGDQGGKLLWELQDYGTAIVTGTPIIIASDLSFSISNATYQSITGDINLEVNFKFFGDQGGKFLWELDSYSVGGQANVAEMQVSAGDNHTLGLKTDGTVLAIGDNLDGRCDVSSWANIKQIFAGDNHSVGLANDGSVVAVGRNMEGQCNVSSWTNIKQIAAGNYHTVGLNNSGTVVAIGQNVQGQGNVASWSDIIQVAAGWHHTVGLKTGGTIVTVGDNTYGQSDLSSWANIKQISAREYNTVGLKTDGTVVASGDNSSGQNDTSFWTNIQQIAVGTHHTVGLKSDGTVVVTGDNTYGQCNVSSWTNIKQVFAGWSHTVGLKNDGTIVAIGYNNDGQCDVSSWDLDQ